MRINAADDIECHMTLHLPCSSTQYYKRRRYTTSPKTFRAYRSELQRASAGASLYEYVARQNSLMRSGHGMIVVYIIPMMAPTSQCARAVDDAADLIAISPPRIWASLPFEERASMRFLKKSYTVSRRASRMSPASAALTPGAFFSAH